MQGERVSYNEMTAFVAEHHGDGPDVDGSMEEFVVEDYWNDERTNVIAASYYYNEGDVVHVIFPDRV